MAPRSFENQATHDQIVEKVKEGLDQVNHDIFINPGQQKNMGVTTINETLYPDIIVTNKGDNHVKIIIEVETEDTVTDLDSKQWKEYADLINAPFWLLVPVTKKETAKQILNRNSISANVGTYSVISGSVRISYE